ncbi:helix-turn-helix domain-containing protein [Brevibacillus sp. 179-C 1.1 NHS]|uniref:helix-turn-helix domain-containing protein n=1 Tax=Brevibacillus sp. 179-C 1.1 NHS TaxID=3235177 RepID=UPI00399FC56B
MKEPMIKVVLMLCFTVLIGAWIISDAVKSIAAYGDNATHNTAEIANTLAVISNRLHDLHQTQLQGKQDQILETAEVAEYLGISEVVLARLLQDEEIPVIKINGIYRFSKRAVDQWVYEKSLNRATYQNW